MKSLLFITTGFLAISLSFSTLGQARLSDKDTQSFCDKSLWLAFNIDLDSCKAATLHCAQKAEFTGLDPKVLSEPFYHCVFSQLDIDAS